MVVVGVFRQRTELGLGGHRRTGAVRRQRTS
jgi:hypothetical protein